MASKLERNLATNADAQERELVGISAGLNQTERDKIGWKSALERMEENNLSLRLSKRQLEDAHKQTRDQWLSLVPNLSSFVSVGESISEISNISSANLNANLVANLNIPNPFDFHASLYALALQKQNAIWSHELDRRRAYVELYSVFLDEQSIADAEAALEKSQRRLASGSASEIPNAFRRIEGEKSMIQRRRAYHRLRVNQLLNSPGANWEPSGTLPHVSYRDRYNRFSIGERFGKLALNLQTIQIESAILQVRRVKFQQWPNVSFNMSTPPLYNSNEGSSFSSDQLLFFTGASKSFTASDIGGRERIRDAKIRLQFTREQLRIRMESELVRIQDGQRNYQRLLDEERLLLAQIRSLEKPTASDMNIVAKDLESLSEAQLQLASVRSQIKQLDLQFLVWDEHHWEN